MHGEFFGQCTYAVARAGSTQSEISVQIDQPQHTVLHVSPKATLVSFRQLREATNRHIFLHSGSPALLITGKVFPRIKHPVLANHSYPAELETTVNQRHYYLLPLKSENGGASATFLIDAADGSVFDKVLMEPMGPRISLAWPKAHSDPENYKFTIESTDNSGSDTTHTRALVFDQLYGRYIQMTDQFGSQTSSLTAEARAGTAFAWNGINIQIVSVSPQDIVYTISTSN